MRTIAIVLFLVCAGALGAQANTPATITVKSNGTTVPFGGHLHVATGASIASLGLEIAIDDVNGGNVWLSALVADGNGADVSAQLGIDYTEWSAGATAVAYTRTPVSGTFGSAGGVGSPGSFIYTVSFAAHDGIENSYAGFKVWVNPPAQPPQITASSGAASLVNAASLSVPQGTTLASLSLQFAVSDPAGQNVAVAATISNAAGTGLQESEFESASVTSPYNLQPASGAFTQAGLVHEIRLWAQNVSGVSYLFAFTVSVAPAAPEVGVLAGGSPVTSSEPAAGTARDFGAVAPGQPSFVLTVQISNAGTADLVLGPLGVTGDVSDFVIDQGGLQAQVAPGAATSFTVQFSPVAAGARQLSISFTHNAANAPKPFVIEFVGAAAVAQPGNVAAGGGSGGQGGCSGLGGVAAPLLLPLLALAALRRRRA